MRISRNPSSSDTSSLGLKVLLSSGLERRADRSSGRTEYANDSFAISCAFACADRPNKGLLRSKMLLRRNSIGVHRGSRRLDSLMVRSEGNNLAVPGSCRDRGSESRGNRRNARALGERDQRQINPESVLQRKAEFDRHQ